MTSHVFLGLVRFAAFASLCAVACSSGSSGKKLTPDADDGAEPPGSGGIPGGRGGALGGGGMNLGAGGVSTPGIGGAPGTGGTMIGRGGMGAGGTGGSAAGGTGGSADAGARGADGPASDRPINTSRDGGAMTLTSLAYKDGQMIPVVHTCAGVGTSPDLSWTAGPADTMSYALVFRDLNNMLAHWVVWDIPANVTSLPAMLGAQALLPMPMGAKQLSFMAGSPGYKGPCPGGMPHTYVFTIHAMKAATLAGVAANATSGAVATLITQGALTTAKLSGTSDAKRP